MEDIIIVVWVAMIVLGSIINAANKRRQKQQQEPKEAPEGSTRPIAINIPTPRSEAQSLEGESLETIPEEFVRRYAPTPQKSNKSGHQSAKQAAQTKAQHNHKVQASAHKPTASLSTPRAKNLPSEEKHALMRDFDLERAVVYSEILQPKYKEYE